MRFRNKLVDYLCDWVMGSSYHLNLAATSSSCVSSNSSGGGCGTSGFTVTCSGSNGLATCGAGGSNMAQLPFLPLSGGAATTTTGSSQGLSIGTISGLPLVLGASCGQLGASVSVLSCGSGIGGTGPSLSLPNSTVVATGLLPSGLIVGQLGTGLNQAPISVPLSNGSGAGNSGNAIATSGIYQPPGLTSSINPSVSNFGTCINAGSINALCGPPLSTSLLGQTLTSVACEVVAPLSSPSSFSSSTSISTSISTMPTGLLIPGLTGLVTLINGGQAWNLVGGQTSTNIAVPTRPGGGNSGLVVGIPLGGSHVLPTSSTSHGAFNGITTGYLQQISGSGIPLNLHSSSNILTGSQAVTPGTNQLLGVGPTGVAGTGTGLIGEYYCIQYCNLQILLLHKTCYILYQR
ncbi:unnamed protein product [Protopolystoma xenopodis]|uniref:Uncharacterized protein n=1 Tax=Protopolystoma xenopodis TaxID=117903 RepID=A0A3S4ZNW4_9PLAT|nr:unnamed protein product [Protopolystoma xenopodis]